MPTVLLIQGFRFFFFSADRVEPIHVHVKRGDGDGKIWLTPSVKPAYLVGFTSQEEKRILEIATENRELIIAKWHEYFE
jgi:hypothetical protein